MPLNCRDSIAFIPVQTRQESFVYKLNVPQTIILMQLGVWVHYQSL